MLWKLRMVPFFYVDSQLLLAFVNFVCNFQCLLHNMEQNARNVLVVNLFLIPCSSSPIWFPKKYFSSRSYHQTFLPHDQPTLILLLLLLLRYLVFYT